MFKSVVLEMMQIHVAKSSPSRKSVQFVKGFKIQNQNFIAPMVIVHVS